MYILDRILQFVGIYMTIGLIFAVGIVEIYEKNAKDRENYNATMRFINDPRTAIPLLMVISVTWPRFLIVFIVEIFKSIIELISERRR